MVRNKTIAAGLLALALSCLTGAVQAVPIQYDFLATGFTALNGSPVPNPSLSGSVTLDGTTVQAIDLTIGSHTYSAGEVSADNPFGGVFVVGGLLNGINTIDALTDDFFMVFDINQLPISPLFSDFSYTVAGINDLFETRFLFVTPQSVPEPSLPALLGLAGLAGVYARRRRGSATRSCAANCCAVPSACVS